jgi:hypothetical protein
MNNIKLKVIRIKTERKLKKKQLTALLMLPMAFVTLAVSLGCIMLVLPVNAKIPYSLNAITNPVHFTTSTDNGVFFANTTNLSNTDGVIGIPRIVASASHVYAAGKDNALNGNGDIFSTSLPIVLYKQVYAIVLDNSSVTSVNYGTSVGLQRNPVRIEFTAHDYYNYYKKYGDEKSKRVFLNNVNWLVDNAVSHGNYSILEYHFPYPVPYPPSYTMKPPWYSGMAQGQALPVLVKAYQITGEKKYLDSAKMLLNSFFVEVKDGGVTYKTSNDGWWYEEYPIIGAKPRVLNGMIWAVLGIYDYYNYTYDSEAKYLFDQGVLALKKNLPYYDNNGNSYYDLLTHNSAPYYHKLHIKLLGLLYNITKEDIFKMYHDKWQNFQNTLIQRNATKVT